MENQSSQVDTNALPLELPDTPQVSPSLPVQSTPEPPKQNYLKSIVVILLIALVGMGALTLYFWQKTSTVTPAVSEVTPTIQPVSSPVVEEIANLKTDTYSNTEYKFTFNLGTEEHALVCPNKNEFNDNVAVWISTGVKSEAECATEGNDASIFASKKAQSVNSVDDWLNQIQSPDNGYKIQTTPITISGVTGVKVTGSRDPNQSSPLPTTINKAVFSNSGILYVVDGSFLTKNFTILK